MDVHGRLIDNKNMEERYRTIVPTFPRMVRPLIELPIHIRWHLMLHDEGLFEGREKTFKRILEERGLKWKPEEFLGWTHISIYRPGYKFPGWKSHYYKA